MYVSAVTLRLRCPTNSPIRAHGTHPAPTTRMCPAQRDTGQLTDGHGATSDEKYALVDPTTKRSVENGARNLWVTETALSTALNASYMAESLSLFGIVVGIALLLSGIGFGILAVGGTLKRVEPAPQFSKKAAPKVGPPVAPTA